MPKSSSKKSAKNTSSDGVKKLAKKAIGDRKLIIISHNEPFEHMKKENGKIEPKVSEGGLVVGVKAMLRYLDHTDKVTDKSPVWIAWATGDADRETVDGKDHAESPEPPMFSVRRMWQSDETGHSHTTLWPLMHSLPQYVSYKQSEWEQYVEINRLFADAVLEEVGTKDAFVWFQDFQFAIAPKMVREARPELQLAMYWHIPFPPWDIFRTHPRYRELLEGLLSTDFIGMHAEDYCRNFLDCCVRTFGKDAKVDAKSQNLTFRKHVIAVRALPMGVDAKDWQARARSEKVLNEMKRLRSQYGLDKRVVISWERADYTKGFMERLSAIERFFEKHPEWLEKVTFVQLVSPTRPTMPVFSDFFMQIGHRVRHVNDRFSLGDWSPILHIPAVVPPETVTAFARIADVGIVSAVRDGLNLVAKEFIASNIDRHGVLLLSEFAGAAIDLKEAVLINPYDTERFADEIFAALTMPDPERQKRMRALQVRVHADATEQWLESMLNVIAKLPKPKTSATKKSAKRRKPKR
jgi:trehalose 6-phosphate synthase/phosphatase